MLTLRPYQTEARYQLNALLNASRNPVFVSPTGTGKTKTATAVIADRVSIGRRVFVLVPSVEIFTQWITDLSDAGLNPGYINDEGMKGQNRAVYVCMAQSLVNILDRVPEKLWPDELFTDECHHSAASTWETIYTFFDRATRCGLTATPERLDGKGLDHLYTDIVQTITMREAVDAGYLAKPLPIVPQKYLDKHDIPDGNPDAPGALEAQAAKLGKLEIIGDVLESYRHIFHGKPVLVACATFGHAELMATRFVEAGWNFEHIHSALPKHERRRMLRGIRSGTIHGLCTVGIGIEGMDIPGLYGLIWLRRTRSLTIYLQFCGRVLRPLPGKKYGVILDPVGNLFLHGFPEADRVWSLAGRGGDGAGSSEPPDVPMRICPWCGVANNPENERCHFCNMQLLDEDGNRVTKKRDLPSFVAGKLIAVTSDGDRQAVENAIIEDVEAVTDAQKKAEQKEAGVLTSTEKKDILEQGIFAGRERRPLFNEAVRGMVRRGGLG